MYKKSAVEAVGSYQDFYLLEDYYLWLRMLMTGIRAITFKSRCSICGQVGYVFKKSRLEVRQDTGKGCSNL